MRRFSALLVIVLACLGIALPVVAAQPVFITFCHAAGQAGTTQFVTLTLPEQAVFGQAGHFNEDGTPQAGHEDDYLGECEEEEVVTTTTTTTQPDGSTTTTTEQPPQETTTTTTVEIVVVEPTTTTTQPEPVVEIGEPAVVVEVEPGPDIEVLPFTGSSDIFWLFVAGGMLVAGLGLIGYNAYTTARYLYIPEDDDE